MIRPDLTLALLALLPLAHLGCGSGRAALDAAGAISDLSASDAEWNNFQNKKTAEMRAGYEEGLAIHAKYMAARPPAGAGIEIADRWYAESTKILEYIDQRFRPVHHSTFYERIMIAESRLAEGWEKLAHELIALHADGLDAHPEKDTLVANLDQTLLNAVTYYERVAGDYTTDHPEVVKRQTELVAQAQRRGAALKVTRAELKQ